MITAIHACNLVAQPPFEHMAELKLRVNSTWPKLVFCSWIRKILLELIDSASLMIEFHDLQGVIHHGGKSFWLGDSSTD